MQVIVYDNLHADAVTAEERGGGVYLYEKRTGSLKKKL